MISIREWFELTFGNMMTSAWGKRILQSVLLSAQSSLAPLKSFGGNTPCPSKFWATIVKLEKILIL